jgi:hypothetical protein
MSLRCPECGAPAPKGAKPGSTYACRGCRTPVLAVERSETPAPASHDVVVSSGPPSPPSPAEGAAETTATGTGFSWRWAIAAFVVLGAAYVGAFELLTAEAKGDRARILAEEGPAVATYPDPGPMPVDDAKRLAVWSAAKKRHETRLRYERKGAWIDIMFAALGLAFAAQTALTAVVAIKARAKTQERQRAEQRERERAASKAARGQEPERRRSS